MIPKTIQFEKFPCAGTLVLDIPIILLVGEADEIVQRAEFKHAPAIFYAMKSCCDKYEKVASEIKRIVLDSLIIEAPPAGLQRGLINVELELERNQRWTTAEMDYLYEKGINPIATKATVGGGVHNFVWGVKFVAAEGSVNKISCSLGAGINSLFIPYLTVEGSETEYSLKALRERFDNRFVDSDFVNEVKFVMTAIEGELQYMTGNRLFDGVKTVELHTAQKFMIALIQQAGIHRD